MAAVTYNVAPDVLSWALREVQNNVVASQYVSVLKEWLNGTKKPTFNQIEELSKGTHIPLGYFFLGKPPKEDVPLIQYRTIQDLEHYNPTRELIDTIDDMEEIVNWTRDCLISNADMPNNLVGKMKGKKNIHEIASFIRNSLNITEDWFQQTKNTTESFKYLREKLSQAGILVMMNGVVRNNTHRPLELTEFRAFTIIDNYAPLIFINATDSPNGRLFSMIHEFVHICLGINDLFNADHSKITGFSNVEVLCNAVTAEILAPDSIFLKTWSQLKEKNLTAKEIISKISEAFNCSSIVIARKALNHSFIDTTTYNDISDIAVKKFYELKEKKSAGGNFYRTMETRLDKRFFSLVLDSVSKGRTQYTEAFRLTNTNRNTFSRIAEAM